VGFLAGGGGEARKLLIDDVRLMIWIFAAFGEF
jgi:hypothetical protein